MPTVWVRVPPWTLMIDPDGPNAWKPNSKYPYWDDLIFYLILAAIILFFLVSV